MIQVKAAERLQVVVAAVNEAEARKYLKSLGVNPGRKMFGERITIAFEIDDAEATADAISKHLQGKAKRGPRTGIKQWSFDIADGHRLLVSDKGVRRPAYVEVIDTSHITGPDKSKMH